MCTGGLTLWLSSGPTRHCVPPTKHQPAVCGEWETLVPALPPRLVRAWTQVWVRTQSPGLGVGHRGDPRMALLGSIPLIHPQVLSTSWGGGCDPSGSVCSGLRWQACGKVKLTFISQRDRRRWSWPDTQSSRCAGGAAARTIWATFSGVSHHCALDQAPRECSNLQSRGRPPSSFSSLHSSQS